MKYKERNDKIKIRIDYFKISALVVLMVLPASISISAQIIPNRVDTAIKNTTTYLN